MKAPTTLQRLAKKEKELEAGMAAAAALVVYYLELELL